MIKSMIYLSMNKMILAEVNKAMAEGISFEQAYRLGAVATYMSLGMNKEAIAWLWQDKAALEQGEY